MTLDEAQQLQISGRYSELLRAAVREQIRASDEGRLEDEIRWTIWVVKASRYLGRVKEGLAHAAHAVERAEVMRNDQLRAETHYVQALMFKVAGRSEEALKSLDRAQSILPPEAPEINLAIFELERAELLLEAGRKEEARAAMNRGSAQVHWIESSRLLAWALYLKAMLEGDWPSDLQLMAASTIAQRVRCPELEWQILWRLAEGAGRAIRPGLEEELAGRARGILLRMSEEVQKDDQRMFWRDAHRAAFLEYGRERFGPAFGESISSEPEFAEPDARMWFWDPELLPSFVKR